MNEWFETIELKCSWMIVGIAMKVLEAELGTGRCIAVLTMPHWDNVWRRENQTNDISSSMSAMSPWLINYRFNFDRPLPHCCSCLGPYKADTPQIYLRHQGRNRHAVFPVPSPPQLIVLWSRAALLLPQLLRCRSSNVSFLHLQCNAMQCNTTNHFRSDSSKYELEGGTPWRIWGPEAVQSK